MSMFPMAEMSAKTLPKKSRVLVVEDHAPTRLAMSKLLREAGADVVTARDGEEGLGYLLTQKFDILLTDLRMPVMDGFELLHHCLSLPEARRPGRIGRDAGGPRPHRLHDIPPTPWPSRPRGRNRGHRTDRTPA